ncbi:MAG: type 1 glutamine amidotransferase [Acidiferrobacterales bacterium]
MSEILIIRHVAHEGPGYLADFFNKEDIAYRVFALDAGEPLSTSLDGIQGLVFMGGPMSANDNLPWIEPALTLIRNAFDSDIPMLGHCLGGQLMAKALGAAISTNPVPEYGWLPVRVADNALAHDWFGDTAKEFDAFHWHGETFDLPEGATHVLDSAHCRNQAFVFGRSLAMQFHIEMTAELARDWVGRADSKMLSPSASIQSHHDILNDLDNKITMLQSNADTIYKRWLHGLR